MAITINQQPTSPNMSNNDLLYVLSSPLISQPQYQYVADVFISGSSTLVQRIKQQPNPSGKAVFNVGQILTANLESDNIWKTSIFTTSTNCNKNFIVRFGEQYGTSVSSSVTLYTGVSPQAAGEPAKTGSEYYVITDGLVDYPDATTDFNFSSGSYYFEELVDDIPFTHSFALSTAPKTQSLREGDYATISFYNGNADGDADPSQAQDIFSMQVSQFDINGVSGTNQFITSSILRGSPGSGILWSNPTVVDSQTNQTTLVHLPVGYQNLTDNGVVWDSDVAYYTIIVHPQATDGFTNELGIWDSLRYNIYSGNCDYSGQRFAWKNEFGVWDYYNFTLQSDESNSVERLGFEKTNIPYNTSTTSATFNVAERGNTQFVNKITRRQNANSDWLTQAEADWLKELFFSTNVFVQVGSNFQPVVITSAEQVSKTNPRSQKNFQYQIEFEPANQTRNRQ
tara:strand:+ start:3229 stop:4590 length:1362 start_codon:yes stop_codon:yes gene_type:complete